MIDKVYRHYVKNTDGTVEQDKIFICNRLLEVQGQIDPVENLNVKSCLNQNGEISFRIYKNNNGNIHPYWDKIDDIGIVLVENKGYYEISVPDTEEDAIFKEVHGITLGEAESSQKLITIWFNDENDANWLPRENENPDINHPSVFFNESDPYHSILHRTMDYLPHYTISHVDDSLKNIQRIFSCENQSIYDFLHTIEEELECIFIFDKFSRSISCYDLKEHCTNPSCISAKNHRKIKNGVCSCCGLPSYVAQGYGTDTGVTINTENLAESITVTGDKDSVKNTFKIVGGDDIITNEIGMRLMDGNTITKFSDYQFNQMSEPLQSALIGHENLVKSKQDEYNELWRQYDELEDKKLYYRSGMMPSLVTSKTTAESIFTTAFGNGSGGKISYAFKTSESQDGKGIMSSVKRDFNLFVPKEYGSEFTYVNFVSSVLTFNVKVFLKDAYKINKDQNDIYTGTVNLPVKNGYTMTFVQNGSTYYTTDYFLYIKNRLDMLLKQSDVKEENISFDPPIANTSSLYSSSTYADYDNESNPYGFSNIHYTMWCVKRLESFRDAYEKCVELVSTLNSGIKENGSILNYITSNGGIGKIYDDLVKKYGMYIDCINARISYLNKKIENLESRSDDVRKEIENIKNLCNMKSYVTTYAGEEYWDELCSFIREDVYQNNNFIGDGLSQKEIFENIELLIERAEEQLEVACEIQYSISANVGNLLILDEFKPFWNNFSLGNWIRCIIDEKVYKMRLVGITYDYTDFSKIELEFSTTTTVYNPISDITSMLSQHSSPATNFNIVVRQGDRNTEENPLKQISYFGNGITFTDDGWLHGQVVVGNILYYNTATGKYELGYGINAEVLKSRIIVSKELSIYNESGTMSMTDDGFVLANGQNKIILLPANPSMEFLRNGETILAFNTPQHPNELYIAGGIIRSKNFNSTGSGRFMFDLDNDIIDLDGCGMIVDRNLSSDYTNLPDTNMWWYSANQSAPLIPVYIFKARIPLLCSCNIQTGILSAESIMVRNGNNPSVILLDGESGDIYANEVNTTSDKNKKNSIEDLDDNLVAKFVELLIPKSYKFNDGKSGRKHWGMIAQDVEKVIKDCGLSSADFAGFIKWKNEQWDGENPDTEYEYALRYEEFIAPLIKYCQMLNKTISEQKKEIDCLKDDIKIMKEQIEELKKIIRRDM